MKRLVYAAVVAVLCAGVLAVAAVAAPAPGTYKGNIYAGAKKGAAGTVKVAGTKVTIKVAKFPCKRQSPSGKFDIPSAPFALRVQGHAEGQLGQRHLHRPARRHGRVRHRQAHVRSGDEVVHREDRSRRQVQGHLDAEGQEVLARCAGVRGRTRLLTRER